MKIEAYVDGCALGTDMPGGWAAVIRDVDSDEDAYLFSGPADVTTTNRMELTAIWYAIRKIRELFPDHSAIIYSDSQYAIGVITRKMVAVANLDLVPLVREALEFDTKIRLQWIRGHSDVVLHDLADRTAREEAMKASKVPKEPLTDQGSNIVNLG